MIIIKKKGRRTCYSHFFFRIRITAVIINRGAMKSNPGASPGTVSFPPAIGSAFSGSGILDT